MSKTKLIFNLYKDDNIRNTQKFRDEISTKYELSTRETTEVLTSIINYQIKRYGSQIGRYYA